MDTYWQGQYDNMQEIVAKINNGINTQESQVNCNVLKIGLVIESEKLSIHDSLVRPVVEPRLNR